MAKFVYIGSLTKANGRVDIKIGTSKNKEYLIMKDVVPNETIVESDDPVTIKYLRRAKGLDQKPLYKEVG